MPGWVSGTKPVKAGFGVLSRTTIWQRQPLDTCILALIFGVVLAAYFGHTSAADAAKIVLQRDPTGKALIWGNIAALATAMGRYILWVVAVNGSIAPDVLAATSGTTLTPLAIPALEQLS